MHMPTTEEIARMSDQDLMIAYSQAELNEDWDTAEHLMPYIDYRFTCDWLPAVTTYFERARLSAAEVVEAWVSSFDEVVEGCRPLVAKLRSHTQVVDCD